MREDRFFVDFEIKKGKLEIENGKIFHQLKNVLRKKIGKRIILFDENLNEGLAEIKKFFKNKFEVEILEIKKNKREPKIFVSLYCSLLKRKNFELVVQKTTEIGVKEIIPIICQNTVKKGINLERLKKISKEATEQSGRVTLPKILEPIKFKEAIKRTKMNDAKIIFDPLGKDFYQFKKEEIKNLDIFIGPEGGWDKSEIEMAKKENFEILNLGKLNLRSETAALIASFLAINLFS